MNQPLHDYVQNLRGKGLHYDEISAILTEAGWSRLEAASALRGEVLPTPPAPAAPAGQNAMLHSGPSRADVAHHQSDTIGREPIAVVQNFSVRGFEYSIMFLTLWASAVSLGALMHERVSSAFPRQDDYYSDDSGLVGFALTVLLVSFPIFVTMFIRLKKAEQREPELHHDPSRRKLTQLTQLVAFVFGMGYIVYFLYNLIVPFSGSYSQSANPSVLESFLHMLVTILIAGGIFAFYWIDDHRKDTK